jgi:hypothetical protein
MYGLWAVPTLLASASIIDNVGEIATDEAASSFHIKPSHISTTKVNVLGEISLPSSIMSQQIFSGNLNYDNTSLLTVSDKDGGVTTQTVIASAHDRVSRIAIITESFSFAYLKELFQPVDGALDGNNRRDADRRNYGFSNSYFKSANE